MVQGPHKNDEFACGLIEGTWIASAYICDGILRQNVFLECYPDKWIALRDRVLRRFAMIDEEELVGVTAL